MANTPQPRDPNTTNLDLIVPTVGGSNDVWGNNLNTDLAKIDAKFAPTGPNRVVQTNAEGYPFGTNLVLDDATGTNRYIWYRTATSDRWVLGTNNTAEGIGNLGSDFELNRFANDGTNLDTIAPALLIERSTGIAKFSHTPQVIGSDGAYHDVVHLGNLLTSAQVLSEPVGTIKMWGGRDDPPGGFFVVCNGRSFPIPTVGVGDQTYVPLYQAIGTTYGQSAGNFLIPNTAARFPLGFSSAQPPPQEWPASYRVDNMGNAFGVGLHTLTTAEMPVHNHPIIDKSHIHNIGAAAQFMAQAGGGGINTNSQSIATTAAFTGITQTENTGSGSGHDNVPPALIVQFIIRVK